MSKLFKSLLLVFKEITNYFFPLSEDEKLIEEISDHEFLSKLQVRECSGCYVLAEFRDPSIRAALHLVKFHRNQKAIELVATLLNTWLHVHLTEAAVVIAVPLSKKRFRARGYNQTEEIVKKAVSDLPHLSLTSGILKRSKDTAPQTSLTRTERINNVENAFLANPKSQTSISGKHIILIDDVMTTGATLRAAKASLLPLSPASITCIAIAH